MVYFLAGAVACSDSREHVGPRLSFPLDLTTKTSAKATKIPKDLIPQTVALITWTVPVIARTVQRVAWSAALIPWSVPVATWSAAVAPSMLEVITWLLDVITSSVCGTTSPDHGRLPSLKGPGSLGFASKSSL